MNVRVEGDVWCVCVFVCGLWSGYKWPFGRYCGWACVSECGCECFRGCELMSLWMRVCVCVCLFVGVMHEGVCMYGCVV